MARLALLLAAPLLALTLAGCDDKSSDDDDDDDDFSSDSGAPDWGDGADGGGDGGDGGGDGADGGGDGSGDGADGGGDGSDGGGANPMPVEGTWGVAGYELISDPCGLAAFQDPGDLLPATMTVTHTGSVGFTVSSDGGEPSTCEAQSSGAYRCSPTSLEQSLSDFGIDATLEIETTLSGTTSADGLDWGVLTGVDISCAGSGCGIIESFGLSFPCSQELDLDVSAP